MGRDVAALDEPMMTQVIVRSGNKVPPDPFLSGGLVIHVAFAMVLMVQTSTGSGRGRTGNRWQGSSNGGVLSGDDDLSPLARAKKLRFSLELQTYATSTRRYIARIADATVYPPQLAKMLDADYAPFAVLRWVADGKYLQDRAIRFALALLMRREAPVDNPRRATMGWVWPKDKLFRTAEKLFWQSPQCDRLVRVSVLSREIPDGKHLFNALWDQTWATIQREFATIDRDAFMRQVQAVIAQRKRRRVRKRMKLGAPELAYVQALDTIKRGIVRGDITLEEAHAHTIATPPSTSSKQRKS